MGFLGQTSTGDTKYGMATNGSPTFLNETMRAPRKRPTVKTRIELLVLVTLSACVVCDADQSTIESLGGEIQAG
ncbi:MAG: hypothetical protein AAF552_12600, partial [Pseudomonadota bacterium]